MTVHPGGTPPRRHPNAACRVYDGEALIVLPEGHVHNVLHSVGNRIWGLIDGVRTQRGIAQEISDEYEVSFEQALQDVVEFVEQLKANGMLAPSDAGKVA